MSLKTDLAERVVASWAAVLRNPDLRAADKVQRAQDIVERALGDYGEAAASSRGSIEQGYRDDRELLEWLCYDWSLRASRVHAEVLLDPESGVKAAIRRARAATREVAA
jgi:hypothetical protein